MLEGNPDRKLVGRDHHKDAFTIWMAGGGFKRGLTYGATCELGYRIAENPVAVHDLQATILHLLGLRHESLTFRFQGRDFRQLERETPSALSCTICAAAPVASSGASPR